jgi:hypothetical protein
MKAILVSVSGQVSEIEISGYEDLRLACGGYIEALRMLDHSAYVNEEGKLMNLPYNRVATALCEHFGVGLMQDDYIVGNMVICGPCDGEGDDTEVGSLMLREVMNFAV